jgi:hypothetical protein
LSQPDAGAFGHRDPRDVRDGGLPLTGDPPWLSYFLLQFSGRNWATNLVLGRAQVTP